MTRGLHTMDEKTGEALSGLTDGELTEHEAERIVDAVRSDEALRRRWARFHLIRETMAQRLPERVDPGFADRVRSALQEEPELLIPEARRHRMLRSLRRRPAAVGAAASFVVASVVAFQFLQAPSELTDPQHQAGPETVQSSPQPFAGFETQGDPLSQVTQVRERGTGWQRQDRAPAAMQPTRVETHRYQTIHQEYSGGSAVQGMVPYLRLIGDQGGSQ